MGETIKVIKIINDHVYLYDGTKLVKSKKIDIINLHIPPLLPTLFIDKKWPLLLTSHTTYKGETGEFFDKSEFKSKSNFFEKKIRFLIEKRAFKNS